jgi:hypothetical protein
MQKAEEEKNNYCYYSYPYVYKIAFLNNLFVYSYV